jgi:hypothetical protein
MRRGEVRELKHDALSGVDILLLPIAIRECNFLCPVIQCMKQASWRSWTQTYNFIKISQTGAQVFDGAAYIFFCNYINKNSRLSKK